MWDRQRLHALVDQRVLLFDGAIGTELYGQGYGFEHSMDALCLTQPLVVRRVHRDYVSAGAAVLTTNTFGANPLRLARDGLSDKAAEINRAAVLIARDAASDRPPYSRPLVAASIGPLGQPLAPIGRLSRVDALAAFRVQIEALLDADPDLFVLETFSDLNELQLVGEVIESLRPGAAWIACATFTDEGKTLLGHKPEEVAATMLAQGAAVVGANCSTGPQAMEEVFERLARVPGGRIMLSPNAGLPSLVDGRYVYVNSPEYFGHWAARMADAGARIIGGCCGTTPAHIARAVAEVGVRAPAIAEPPGSTGASRVSYPGSPQAVVEGASASLSSGIDAIAGTSSFERKLAAGEFAISVELDPPRGVRYQRLVQGAMALRQAGVDAINIADSPLATARMSPLALAVLIRQRVDIEIVLHVSCRDRNVLGLLSETLGAHALGIQHLLCVTGDPPSVGNYPGTKGVFEVDSIGLLRMLEGLNQGESVQGKRRKTRTEFKLSCAVNPSADDLELELDRFAEKQAAGATYALTQPLYDPEILARFIARARPKIPILVGILPLRNGRHAHFIHHEVPGMFVPAPILARMERAGERGPEVGVAIGRELLKEMRPLCAGAYLMPPFNKYEMAIELLRF